LLFTANGGETWAPVAGAIESALGPFAHVDGACLTRGGYGVAVVATRVLLTRDRGATWQPGPRFAFERTGEGWAIRGEGFTSPHLVRRRRPVDRRLRRRPTRADAVALPDGGATWEDLSDAVGEVPQGVSIAAFAGSGVGWLWLGAGDRSPQLRRSTDGGRSWSVLAIPLRPRPRERSADLLEALALATDGSGIAAAATHVDERRAWELSLLVTSDAGTHWRRTHPPADLSPLAVAIAE
jgi:photosystem II stability/assembly factor-like uncharacterized protein